MMPVLFLAACLGVGLVLRAVRFRFRCRREWREFVATIEGDRRNREAIARSIVAMALEVPDERDR